VEDIEAALADILVSVILGEAADVAHVRVDDIPIYDQKTERSLRAIRAERQAYLDALTVQAMYGDLPPMIVPKGSLSELPS
jgi:hypothetical protein